MTTPTADRTPTGVPPAARRYITLLSVVAAAGFIATLVWAATDLTAILSASAILLTVMGIVSVAVPLRFHHDGDVQGFNVSSAVYLALLVLVPDPVAVVAACVTAAVGYAIATRSLVKTTFNTAQAVVVASGATWAARLVARGEVTVDVLSVAGLGILVVALLVLFLTNELLTTELFHRHSGRSRRALLRDVIGPVTAISLGGNYVVALLLVVLAERSPAAVVLAVPLFAGLLLGYRGFAADRELARQAQLLHRTSRKLLDGAVDDAALEDAVGGLRDLFGADRAVLAAGESNGPAWLRSVVTEVRATGEPVQHTEETSVLAAPVEVDGRVVGALAVSGRRGLTAWGASDLALLSTVAGEIAATLRTRRLLGELEAERASLAVETGKLTDVLASASDGIIVIDHEGAVEACNPAMADVVGMAVEDAVGTRWNEVLRLEDEDGAALRDTLDDPLVRALSGDGGVDRTTTALRRPDGEVRWLGCSAAPVVSDGVQTGVVLVAVDLTRERELEQLRSDFIATVSHELRTPLTPLSGFLGVLREHGGAIDDDRREMMVGAMEKQVGRLSDLIGDLLQVAELEKGMTHIHHEVVAIVDVVDDVVDVEAVAPDDRGRISLQLEPAHAMADRTAVRRIVRALVSNGLKHTDGTVTIASCERDGAVVVTVSDEGPGIADWARDAIFEPFRRLGNHLHRTQGPGLGLSVARSLAEALDGSLGVSSPPGGGASFVLMLPASGVTEAPVRTRRVDNRV